MTSKNSLPLKRSDKRRALGIDIEKQFPWYRAENYDGLNSFNALAWWRVLSFRFRLLNGTKAELNEGFNFIQTRPLASRDFDSLLKRSVRETTYVEWRSLSYIYENEFIRDRVNKWRSQYGKMSLGEYALHVYFSTAPKLVSPHEWGIRYLKKRIHAPSPMLKEYAEAATRAPVVLSIDLAAPDEVLMQEFSNLLARKRAEMDDAERPAGVSHKRKKIGKPFTKANFVAWSETRVLAYLDIKIACLAQSIDLPSNAALSNLLLKTYTRRKSRGEGSNPRYGVDHSSVISTQTKVHADALMCDSALHSLYTQGIAEWASTSTEKTHQ